MAAVVRNDTGMVQVRSAEHLTTLVGAPVTSFPVPLRVYRP
ncbi:hypothetical protein JOE11_003505 [Robbsia andropogonis]